MYSHDTGNVELQPLKTEPDSIEISTGQRWRRHDTLSLSDPRLQKRLWIAVAVAVLVGAGVILAATSTTHKRAQGSSGATADGESSSLQGDPQSQPFPADPYLAPVGTCQLDAELTGPEQQLGIPLNYHVWLNLSDPAYYTPGDATGRVAAGFAGRVSISMHIEQDASCLSLHAHNLSISSMSVRLLGAAWKQTQHQQQQQQQQQAVDAEVCLCGVAAGCLTPLCGRLFKARPGSSAWILSLGPYVAPAGSTLLLHINYTAAFGRNKQGLWRSAAYPAPGAPGQEVVALASEFEMNAARMVLPCLDEPQYKATFVVEIDAPSDMTVLSNAPAAATRWILSSADSSVSRVTFQPTPPMSSYLLSIAVGHLKAATAHSSSGHTVRVWTTPDTIAAAAVPLQLSVSALHHYQAFTGIPQDRGPDTKWDLLAVPGKTGAVENWKLLMMDPERFLFSSGGAWDLFRCANVICHEMAHQWYGNLVTAAGWPDLLVNEGLATLAEYGCMAAVLPTQVGLQGAAVLMRGMFGGPAGASPGVHEGPFEKTLTYDASPLAQPLLGSGVVEFGVPVYSKAAALMAMVATYAAAAAAAAAATGATQDDSAAAGHQQYGAASDLISRDPASALQVALREHLQQHAFSTATAQDTLARLIRLAPADMSSNTLAVMTGWQSPGTPLVQLTTTTQGIMLQQRRFCSWGLLDDSWLTQLLASAGSGAVTAQVPAPPVSTNSSLVNSSGALLCPTALDGQDRAVPWTPLYVARLPDAPLSPINSSSNSSSTDSSQGQVSCGQWVVLRRDKQTVEIPNGCDSLQPANTSAGSQAGPVGYILEGDGGWGVYRSLYTAEQRAALRQWVVRYVQQGSSVDDAGHGGSVGLGLLLTASKILQDQAALGLSAFGEVPGAEVWEVLLAAVNASRAAGGALQQSSSSGPSGVSQPAVGCGTVLYTLLAPVVPAVEVWMDRLAANKTCWLQQQERLAETLAPVASLALSAFAGGKAQLNTTINTTSLHSSPDDFLGAMTLNRLVKAAALVDADTANKLCNSFNKAAAAAEDGAGAAALLGHIHPDLRHAVLDVAAAQPPGCHLDWSGDKLVSTLRQWYLSDRDPRVATMAAFALAHFPARGLHSTSPWQDILSLLLAINNTDSTSSTSHTQAPPAAAEAAAQTNPQHPASGISPSKHAVELAVLVSRAVTFSRRFPQPDSTAADTASEAGSKTSPVSATSSPVLAVLTQQWSQVVSSVGEGTAWAVLREVSASEVLTAQQWQGLAVWAVQQAQVASGGSVDVSMAEAQRKRVQALLGAAWSTVSWVQVNANGICEN